MLVTDVNYIMSGYRRGIFPMAESKSSRKIFWVKPEERGIIPIGQLHISRSLKKFIKSNNFYTTTNSCFSEVVERCADRENSWINPELFNLYIDLHHEGYAISIEIWLNQELVGGLFGITVGSCFCGESMFSTIKNGSKLALIVTMARLTYNNYKLFDTQFLTEHLKSMGGKTISQASYENFLAPIINDDRSLLPLPKDYSWSDLVQLNNHIL